MPANTVVTLIATEEISSINMKVGDTHQIQVASDVTEGGKVIIPPLIHDRARVWELING